MSKKPNPRRNEPSKQDNGPGYESRTPAAGCNSTHVARSRSKWKRCANRVERRTGAYHPDAPMHTARIRPSIDLEDLEPTVKPVDPQPGAGS